LLLTRPGWVDYCWPTETIGIEFGDFALFQYNKLSLCLLLNRPKTSFTTLHSHGKQDAAVLSSLGVISTLKRTSAYIKSYDLVEFLS
jgi:hypothetical protein